MSDKFWQRLNFIAGILAIGVVFGLTSFMASLEIKDLDLWLHLKLGEIISSKFFIPSSDILSCSIAGKPWVNHEWLFQVVVYQVWHWWDFTGLINMQIGIVFLTFLLLLFLGYSKDRQFATALFLLGVLFIYQSRFTIRPDIFSLLFFVSFVFILSSYINRSWSLWVLVAIQILWTNMHGFFFFGPLLVAIAILSEFLKRRTPLPWEWNQIGRLNDQEYLCLKQIFPLLLLACCVNPLTIKGALYPLGVLFGLQGSNNVFFKHITELQRPITEATIWTGQYGAYKAIIIMSGVSLFLNRRKIDISTIFIWVIFLVFSLAAIRNMVFFAVAGYLVFMANASTINWQGILPLNISQNRFKYITAIVLKGFLIFWMVDNGTKIAVNGYFDYDTYERKSEFGGVSLRSFPYHGVDFLVKNKIQGNFFNDFNSGAYIIGRCYPNIKVYIDGRTEEYGADFFENHYQKIWRDGDQKVFLADAEKFNITGVFLNNNNQQIAAKTLKMFYQLPQWKIVYFDYDAVIFLKDIPANKVWIDQFGIDLKKWQSKTMDLQKIGTKRVEPLPLTNRAYLLKTLGFYDAAIKEIQNALKIEPDDFDSYKYLGEIYAFKGDHRRSFENYRIATILKTYDTDIRSHLALSYENLKDYEGAISQYERILEIAPKSATGYFGLARVNAIRGKNKEAFNYLKQAQALAPEDKVDVKKIHDIMDKNKKAKEEALTVVQKIIAAPAPNPAVQVNDKKIKD